MPKQKITRLPRIKTHKSLFANKVHLKTHKKIDQITEKTGVAKWMVIDKLLSEALGIKTDNKLDLSQWLGN